jgi:hypothetical protein
MENSHGRASRVSVVVVLTLPQANANPPPAFTNFSFSLSHQLPVAFAQELVLSLSSQRRQAMLRSTVLAAAVVLLCTAPLTARDTKTKKPLGTWIKSGGDVEVKFHFEADTLRCTISAMGLVIDVDGDYGMSKDGTIFGRLSKVEKKGIDGGPKAGDLFTFRVKMKDNVLTISNLGPEDNADARQLIEGDYKKKK